MQKDKSLNPANMINLYAQGAFPMADQNGKIDWFFPQVRTIIPLDNFNIPHSLKKFLITSEFSFEYDKETMNVVLNCANREDTWISDTLIDAYSKLENLGFLHSVSVYSSDKLIGGLYGVSYKGAFFGESMFSKRTQASKCALLKLIERLNKNNFSLLDVQYQTEHLKMFGALEIDLTSYDELLLKAILSDTSFI